MAAVVDICNRALQKLGAARIISLTDQSVNARACSLAYLPRRDALLRAHPWCFAIKRFSLAADATAPAFGPANSYTLPTGWLNVLPPDPAFNSNDRDWIVEGNSLLTNQTAPLNVRCVMQVDDPNLMDANFREALASDMAYEMCEALTQSNEKKASCSLDKKKAIDDAKKANAIEKVPQVAVDASWITVRA